MQCSGMAQEGNISLNLNDEEPDKQRSGAVFDQHVAKALKQELAW